MNRFSSARAQRRYSPRHLAPAPLVLAATILVASCGEAGSASPGTGGGGGQSGRGGITSTGGQSAGGQSADGGHGNRDAGASSQPGAPSVGGCKMFPDDHILNTTVVYADVHARSSAWLLRMRAVSGPHPGPGAGTLVWQGSRAGIPLNVGGVSRTLATDGSYGLAIGTFSTIMPTSPRIEGEPNPAGAWDKHVLTLDPAACTLTEVIQYRNDLVRGWLVGGGVTWDLKSNGPSRRLVDGAGGAEAAGLPMAILLYRYDEVAAGEIRHPIRIAGDSISPTAPLWPALSSDGRDKDPDALPMGARLRLRGDTDLSALGAQAKVIAKAMQIYGVVMADSTPDGGGWGLGGEGDDRWDDADLATLRTLDLNQFDVVDVSMWKVADGSNQAKPP